MLRAGESEQHLLSIFGGNVVFCIQRGADYELVMYSLYYGEVSFRNFLVVVGLLSLCVF